MPIHVRAEPGDYAEACLLPGDPLRAKYIAETFFDDPVQQNAERGMLGYTGTFEGKPVSVQATGMGCPSAAIVVEELVQLGVKRVACEPHVPPADFGRVHGAAHAAKELGKPVRVGPIVSSDLFYNPDEGQYERWSARGVLAVEMEASVLFTLGALRQVQAGWLLAGSDGF